MKYPLATYRLQFRPEFGFADAERIIDYLATLGVSTVYASPIFKARPGSTHGYDVTDPNQLNPELGTREAFESLTATVQRHGMTWLQDFVPNHMAYDSRNRMLMDVFEKGPGSPYAAFFDILWDHLRENLRGKVIAPFLGKPYGETLESGELSLQYGDGNFAVKYYDSVYPLRIESYATFISHQLNELKERLGAEDPDFIKMLGIVVVLTNLADDPKAEPLARTAQMLLARDALWAMYRDNPAVREFIDRRVGEFNGDVNLLDAMLAQQWFQFTYWRVASKEINYQRFFNINELISLRMEDERVFDVVHRLALSLLNEGKIHGLRIDHVDGLYNPTEYVERLRRRAPGAYLVVEKILELSEQLPGIWRVEGTTGYDFLNYVNELFVDRGSERRFQQIYSTFSGEALEYAELLYEKKKLIIERHLTGDLDNLTSVLKTISTTTRDAIDLAWEALMQAITEAAAVFPVYRTYIAGGEISRQERRHVEEAIAKAKGKNPTLERALDFLHQVLLLDYPNYLAEDHRAQWRDFVMRFQQFTSPLMAKGLEDTAFYVFNRLVSLNEVGGNPGRFGLSVDEFHAAVGRRAQSFPHTMNATATHDTKRGEDVRARINVLSEMPDEWQRHIAEWHELNKRLKRSVEGEEVPSRNREYFLYQTLIGAWPSAGGVDESLVERMKQYMLKAAREAKTHTFWLDNNSEYEAALLDFTEKLLTASPEFLERFTPFQKRVAHYGVFNSLAQTVIKLTAPGVPDLYQGTELWDLSLVDPDNRRPVDYEQRRQLLSEVRAAAGSNVAALADDLLRTREDGRVKLFVTHRTLQARRDQGELFEQGDYLPLSVTGEHAAHVVAFARRLGARLAVTIAPRLLVPLVGEDELPVGEVWRDTTVELPKDAPAAWHNQFSDEALKATERIAVADALRRFPVALLV
ncbi:MAG TPA: malto-oligosyltrehalose synthase [Blastocatellia bacterium]|nr:malto-oligosyltrehalose synthase [Blastocatellia bacterium]